MNDLGEETANHKSPRIRLIDAARHQVEEVLIVESPGGRSMTCSDDLTGLNLEIGNRVSARTIGEEKISIHLVGIGAFGILSDVDIPKPDRSRF